MQVNYVVGKPIKSMFDGYDKYMKEGFVKKGKLMPTLQALRLPQSTLQKFMGK